MNKRNLRQPNFYEARRDFTTKTGGAGYVIRNNPLGRSVGGAG